MLEKSTRKPRKLRPVILSCDNRLDTFKIFVESYKKIAHSMLRPIILAGYNHPERRQEYNQLLKQLNPHKIIEQTNHYWDKDPTEELRKLPKRYRRLNYINVQRTMIKDFPRIALEHSKEDVVFIEDDTFFSSQFPKAIKKVSQYLQSDCDLITLYSPTPYGPQENKWHERRGITDNGYTTKQSLPSNDFIHAIDGNCYYGTICTAFSRKALISLRDNWEEANNLSTAYDEKWGIYMAQKSFKVYATRLSYVQHQAGHSILNSSDRAIQTKTFYDPKPRHFKIIVPVYNAEEWISTSIKSIQSQKYSNYKVIIVDDCSTDNTYKIASKLIKGNKRFTLIRNKKRGGAMASSIIGINASAAKDEHIILRLDGDDWLARTDALSIIKKTYDTKNCLMTYGSFLSDPSSTLQKLYGWGDGGPTVAYPRECIINNNFRKGEWLCPPPRTFEYHLWKRIEDSDFRDIDGEYYSMSSDQAMMLPILEMAGVRQAAISEVLYIYNKNNPINDHKVNRKFQVELEKRIREKRRYTPVDVCAQTSTFVE